MGRGALGAGMTEKIVQPECPRCGTTLIEGYRTDLSFAFRGVSEEWCNDLALSACPSNSCDYMASAWGAKSVESHPEIRIKQLEAEKAELEAELLQRDGQFSRSIIREQVLEARRFHKENPEVWKLFVHFTFQLINAGRKNGGAKAVWERLRWETSVNPDRADEFKLNNNFTTYYARSFQAVYPQHEDFFRYRERGEGL